MKILKLICLAVLSMNIQANAMIRNVPAQYTTIQSAVISCNNRDTVLVQPGIYFENVNFRGKNIILTSRYYQNNDYSFIQSTIINGSNPAFADTGSCVMIINHEDSTTVLQGFTLTGGSGTKWADEHGAGLYREGGGVLVAFSFPVIQNNIITDNHCELGGVQSTGGGGLRIGDCYCKLFNNIIISNSARYGAGIVLNYAGGEYKNNVICKNFGAQDFGAGAGFWLNSNYTRPRIIENNTIVANTAVTGIPGVYGSGGVQASLINNIIWGNLSPSTGQISGNAVAVKYCDVQGGYNGGGNVNLDPVFDSTNYYIKSNSPCIDIGDSLSIYDDPQDLNNPPFAQWPARGSLRNDMGAYGGQGSKVIANTIVGIQSQQEIINPDKYYLGQNYPNPFNPVTKIEYFIPQNSFVQLDIYNSLGEKVETIINRFQTEGNYNVTWNAGNYSSGIYFYELTRIW